MNIQFLKMAIAYELRHVIFEAARRGPCFIVSMTAPSTFVVLR